MINFLKFGSKSPNWFLVLSAPELSVSGGALNSGAPYKVPPRAGGKAQNRSRLRTGIPRWTCVRLASRGARTDQEKSNPQNVGTRTRSRISVVGLVIQVHRFGFIVQLLSCLHCRRTNRNDCLWQFAEAVQQTHNRKPVGKWPLRPNFLANEYYSR